MHDPDLHQTAAKVAKMLAFHCVRNSYLEDLHAGIFPSSKTGDYADVKVISPYGEIAWNRVSRISDDEMKHLGKLTGLSEFKFNMKNITDAGISHLQGCKKLTSLNLYGTKITDSSMEVISQFCELKKLHINGTKVSPSSIQYLKQLPRIITN